MLGDEQDGAVDIAAQKVLNWRTTSAGSEVTGGSIRRPEMCMLLVSEVIVRPVPPAG
jgi:hypothetical protein